MTLILSPNQCLIFFRDPEAAFTPARLKQVLRDDGVTVTGRKEPFAARWGDGPTLYVSLLRGDFVEAIARRLVGRRRKYRDLIPGCDTQVTIAFHDLDEVLQDMHTLILVQEAVRGATRGLLYNSWNQALAGPDG